MGTVLGLQINRLLSDRISGKESIIVGIGSMSSAIGATIAFNLTRERESSAQSPSLAAAGIYLDLMRVRF